MGGQAPREQGEKKSRAFVISRQGRSQTSVCMASNPLDPGAVGSAEARSWDTCHLPGEQEGLGFPTMAGAQHAEWVAQRTRLGAPGAQPTCPIPQVQEWGHRTVCWWTAGASSTHRTRVPHLTRPLHLVSGVGFPSPNTGSYDGSRHGKATG